MEREKPPVKEAKPVEAQPGIPQFAQQQFQDTTKQIRRLIDQYRNKPDYYAHLGNYAVPLNQSTLNEFLTGFLPKGDGVVCGQWVAVCRIS